MLKYPELHESARANSRFYRRKNDTSNFNSRATLSQDHIYTYRYYLQTTILYLGVVYNRNIFLKCVCLRPHGRRENFYGNRNRFEAIYTYEGSEAQGI